MQHCIGCRLDKWEPVETWDKQCSPEYYVVVHNINGKNVIGFLCLDENKAYSKLEQVNRYFQIPYDVYANIKKYVKER